MYCVAVAVATAVEALYIEMRYLCVPRRPHHQMAASCGTHCIVCCTFLCLECKEDDKTFGGHLTAHSYEN